jgi:hypothetical protein
MGAWVGAVPWKSVIIWVGAVQEKRQYLLQSAGTREMGSPRTFVECVAARTEEKLVEKRSGRVQGGKSGPEVLFCMPKRTNCILLMGGRRPGEGGGNARAVASGLCSRHR